VKPRQGRFFPSAGDCSGRTGSSFLPSPQKGKNESGQWAGADRAPPSSWQRIRLAHPPVEPRVPADAGNAQGHPRLGKDPRAPLVPEMDGGTMT
jgi:hypothetical protein